MVIFHVFLVIAIVVVVVVVTSTSSLLLLLPFADLSFVVGTVEKTGKDARNKQKNKKCDVFLKKNRNVN
jgi:hypothetical protein